MDGGMFRVGAAGGNLGFVEVPDGRVSRLHCIIKLEQQEEGGSLQAQLEDVSSNGTYVNGLLVQKGQQVCV